MQPDEPGLLAATTPPADTLTWDWREQPDLDDLAGILARHGVRLEQVTTGRDDYEIRISSDPRQQWTSWADTPEPSTPPAVAAQETPADPGPPAGTPQAADDRTEPILGRALLTRDGHLLTRPPDSRAAWGSGFVRSLVRAHAEDLYGAREVLLVSPAAGKVLEAARRLVRDWDANPFSAETAAAKAALAVAVDAMVGDHPAEPAPEPDGSPTATELGDRWCCDTCRRVAEVAVRELDSGTGWDRAEIELLIEWLKEHAADRGDGAAEQVRALLAAVDRLAEELNGARADAARETTNATQWLHQAIAASHLEMDRDEARADLVTRTRERDRARAEVAQVTADRDRLHRLAGEMTGEVGAANAALVEARQRVKARDEALASCVWVDPGRQSGQPCLGGTRIPVGLIHGLLADGLDGDAIRESYFGVTDEHLIAVRHFDALLASAYREGAADALEWLAGDALCADDRRQAVRDVAAAMLAGEWTVPARTEEAIPDGE